MIEMRNDGLEIQKKMRSVCSYLKDEMETMN